MFLQTLILFIFFFLLKFTFFIYVLLLYLYIGYVGEYIFCEISFLRISFIFMQILPFIFDVMAYDVMENVRYSSPNQNVFYGSLKILTLIFGHFRYKRLAKQVTYYLLLYFMQTIDCFHKKRAL